MTELNRPHQTGYTGYLLARISAQISRAEALQYQLNRAKNEIFISRPIIAALALIVAGLCLNWPGGAL
jgi:hypothetical protein